MNDSTESPQGPHPAWLLLVHRLPPKPDYVRVKVRRRLQRLGARALKNSVYVLPNTEASLEDFVWLRREIEAVGGEAMVCEANFVDGITNAAVQRLMTGAADSGPRAPARARPSRTPRGATWVTRRGVGIDRIASAWLIRRFIDPRATFKFVAPRGYRLRRGELRFDMFDAEYTHEGERCTFETLLKQFGLKDRALMVLSQIVHDIDCKDEKFARPEMRGVMLVIDGLMRTTADDRPRLERGATVLDDLYGQLRRK